MYTVEQAKQKVSEYVNSKKEYGDDYELVVSLSQEKPYGWIFSYQTKEYLETDDFRKAVLGNVPILFEKDTGELIPLGIAPSVDYFIDLYEKGELDY